MIEVILLHTYCVRRLIRRRRKWSRLATKQKLNDKEKKRKEKSVDRKLSSKSNLKVAWVFNLLSCINVSLGLVCWLVGWLVRRRRKIDEEKYNSTRRRKYNVQKIGYKS